MKSLKLSHTINIIKTILRLKTFCFLENSHYAFGEYFSIIIITTSNNMLKNETSQCRIKHILMSDCKMCINPLRLWFYPSFKYFWTRSEAFDRVQRWSFLRKELKLIWWKVLRRKLEYRRIKYSAST